MNEDELGMSIEKFFFLQENFPISYLGYEEKGEFDCYYKFRCDLKQGVVHVLKMFRVDIYSGNCKSFDGSSQIKSVEEFKKEDWRMQQK